MEAIEATSFTWPTAVPAAGEAPGLAALQPAGPPHAGRLTCAGQPWMFRGGFDRILREVPLTAWQQPQRQGWQRIKENARREVWRAHFAGSVYYLKYYGRSGWGERVKRWVRGSACAGEWKSGVYAQAAGIPAVAPAGYTTDLRRDRRLCDLLVTEAIEPAYPLDEFWERILHDPDARRRRRDTAQLAELLGEMIARAHQAGFEHLDMHAANILVQPIAVGRYRTFFVDLQSARLGVPIRDGAVVRNLAQLNQWFRRHSTLGDRLRFLRAYARWRNEYETAFAYGRPLGVSFRALLHALILAADRHARRLWAQRDRRALRDGRYFTRLTVGGGWRGSVVLQTKHQTEESRASHLVTERSWWATQLENPLRWFTGEQALVCKESHSASVRRALLAHPFDQLPVIIKRPLARNWWRRVAQLWPPSRSLRGWQIGHALLHRNLPAARPLAVLQRRLGPLVLDSLLITEALPGAVDLDTHLQTERSRLPAADWFRHKRELGALVARQLRLLEERRFVHRDCKAGNLLVLKQPGLQLCWIDMDGLRVAGRGPSRRQRLQPLVRLHVSLLGVPGLTRTDRVRFLKSYCARWASTPQDWRDLWRRLAPMVQKKSAAHEAHRLWKLAHYGRE